MAVGQSETVPENELPATSDAEAKESKVEALRTSANTFLISMSLTAE